MSVQHLLDCTHMAKFFVSCRRFTHPLSDLSAHSKHVSCPCSCLFHTSVMQWGLCVCLQLHLSLLGRQWKQFVTGESFSEHVSRWCMRAVPLSCCGHVAFHTPVRVKGVPGVLGNGATPPVVVHRSDIARMMCTETRPSKAPF